MHLRLLRLIVALPTAGFAQLALTPSTTEGPYNPFNSTQRLDTTALVDADNDLTQVGADPTRASGTRMILSGTLPNTAGAFAIASAFSLPAGAACTATISGVNGATGEAMVEIYEAP